MTKRLFILLCLLVLAGCLKLDPFLFSGEPLDDYLYDSYTGDMELNDALAALDSLQAAGQVQVYDPSYITEYTFQSGDDTLYGALIHTNSTLDSNDILVLLCHGTTGHMDYKWARSRLIYASGYPVFSFDYRGYGLSTGTPDEQGLYTDGQAALDLVRDVLGSPRVILYGQSLGSIIAVDLAAKNNPLVDGLVLESPVGSMTTIVGDSAYLNIPDTLCSSFTTDNINKIKSYSGPFFWMHGYNDETLNYYTHGMQIWNNYSGDTSLHCRIMTGGHDDLEKVIGYLDYTRLLKGYISMDTNLIAAVGSGNELVWLYGTIVD